MVTHSPTTFQIITIQQEYLADLISVPNAAERLDTTAQSIRNAMKDGRIPEDAVVVIDNTYTVLRWSIIKHLRIREYIKISERKKTTI